MKKFFLFIQILLLAPVLAQRDLKLEIRASFGDEKLVLGKTYICVSGDTISIDRLRYYITAITLKFGSGKVFAEENSYHLMDVEEPGSQCIILKNVPEGEITSLEFNIGVDSIASVSGALSGDLDPVKGMYWAWNSGYINAKLEGQRHHAKKKETFEYHIGGYMQPQYAMRQITLPAKELKLLSDKILIKADVCKWLAGIDMKKTKSVMIPGKEAMLVADAYSKMFSLIQE